MAAMSTRDKWILSAAPAMILAVIYAYGAGGKAQTRLTAFRTELQVERAKRFNIMTLQKASTDNEQLQTDLEKARAEATRINALTPEPSALSINDRARALEMISRTLVSNGLYLVKSERQEGESKNAVPSQLQSLWTKLPDSIRPPAPQIWRFEVRGSFTHLHEAVEALAKSKTFIAPLSVSMEPWNANIFKWTVTVWL